VKTALKTLEKYELIFRKRQGAGLPSKIYVKLWTENCLTEETNFSNQTDKNQSTRKKASKMKKQIYRNYDCEEGDSL